MAIDEKYRTLAVQLLKYGVVGGVSFVVDYGALWLLTEVAGVHHLVSAAIAFILGLTCNYLLSTAWVFGESRLKSTAAEFTAFALIGVVGLGLNELIIFLIADVAEVHYMIAKLVSTALVFFWNFFARRFLLFRS